MTALFSPSMPMETRAGALHIGLLDQQHLEAGFFSFALMAAMGPPVPPPMTRMSVSTISVLMSLKGFAPQKGRRPKRATC